MYLIHLARSLPRAHSGSGSTSSCRVSWAKLDTAKENPKSPSDKNYKKPTQTRNMQSRQAILQFAKLSKNAKHSEPFRTTNQCSIPSRFVSLAPHRIGSSCTLSLSASSWIGFGSSCSSKSAGSSMMSSGLGACAWNPSCSFKHGATWHNLASLRRHQWHGATEWKAAFLNVESSKCYFWIAMRFWTWSPWYVWPSHHTIYVNVSPELRRWNDTKLLMTSTSTHHRMMRGLLRPHECATFHAIPNLGPCHEQQKRSAFMPDDWCIHLPLHRKISSKSKHTLAVLVAGILVCRGQKRIVTIHVYP